VIVTEKMAREACVDLGWGPETLNDELTTAGVGAQYRLMAKRAHPDCEGGSVEAFAKVDRAKHVLFAWLERRDRAEPQPAHGNKCRRCEGKGYVESHRAFRVMKIACPLCRGLGEEGVEAEKGHDS
jgi:hypothetical protein